MKLRFEIEIGPSLWPAAAVDRPWDDAEVRLLLDKVAAAGGNAPPGNLQ